MRRAIKLALVFGICASGIFIYYSGAFGQLIYKSAEAGKYIGIFGTLIPVMYLDTAVDGMLKGLDEQLSSMKFNILDSAVSVVLVYTLLPRIGIYGYVITVFFTELLNSSLSLYQLLKVTGAKIPVVKYVLFPALCTVGACAVSGILLKLLSSVITNNTVRLVTGILFCIIVYIALLALLGVMTREDADWLKKGFSKDNGKLHIENSTNIC